MLFRIDDYREDPARDVDVLKMLDELRERRDRLDEAILALTRLSPGTAATPSTRAKKKSLAFRPQSDNRIQTRGASRRINSEK